MNINKILEKEFSLNKTYVENIIALIDEGNTIPFIARYRKELTGSLDDQILRDFFDRLNYLRNMSEKQEQIIKLIDEQEKLTDELLVSIKNAKTLTELDDIYRPYRPKRRTRATIAKGKGLEPLANILWLQILDKTLDDYLLLYIDEEKEVFEAADALAGAKDIIAERISDDAQIRKIIRNVTFESGILKTLAVKDSESSVYEMYYDYEEKVKTIANHRVLAVNRGEKEKFLSVKLEVDVDKIVALIANKTIIFESPVREVLLETIVDSYQRLIAPSIEREVRSELSEQAEEAAAKIFAENLKQLLLQAPIKDKVVLSIDPAFRTGCKIAVVSVTGLSLETTVVFPTAPQNKILEAEKVLLALIKKYGVELIAIGNGTASRESEQFTADMIKNNKLKIPYVIVNEAGASVYSASKLAAKEFPDHDVSLRSAISIARRVQDPLAELVKIDPKAIGVGQYQHDINQKMLENTLTGVVENCVNTVGVDLNTASSSLLSYVAGLSESVSNNIIAFRDENGKFSSRKQLLKIPKLGPKTFLQCAGFLRIPESKNVLDNTAVHPESYAVAEEVLKTLSISKDELGQNKQLNIKKSIQDIDELSKKLEVGKLTLIDILEELEKPGRDLRDDMPKPVLRSDILEMEDLEVDMILKGTVRNVIDFGAFIDIGVGQDGLVHVSEISNKYIKHPLEVLKVTDLVTVKVLSVDIPRKRISLSMKGLND